MEREGNLPFDRCRAQLKETRSTGAFGDSGCVVGHRHRVPMDVSSGNAPVGLIKGCGRYYRDIAPRLTYRLVVRKLTQERIRASDTSEEGFLTLPREY